MKRVITPFSNVIRAEREKPAIGADRRSARSGDWNSNQTGDIVSDQRNVNLVGLATRRESSNVCVWGGITIDYEAHGIGGQSRGTRRGTEGAENAKRPRAEGALAQPLWHAAPSEDSPLSPDRGGCPPNAGECAGR